LGLRKAAPADAHALSAFASRAFWDTYRDIDDPHAIATYVAEHLCPRALAAVIGDCTSVTLLAEVGSILAGYAILSRSQPPSCVVGSDPIELSRFYLGATFIGCGYGRELMHAVHAQARQLGARTLWLGVYDRNARAVRFYERSGMTKVGGKEFLFGSQVYIDPIYSGPVQGAPLG
jgi:GNAT superfamily N-acetyltransferase